MPYYAKKNCNSIEKLYNYKEIFMRERIYEKTCAFIGFFDAFFCFCTGCKTAKTNNKANDY
jgi:hypothetical protein